MNTIQNCKEFCERYRGKIFAVTNRSLVNEGSFCKQIEKIGQTKPDSIILREKDMSLSEYTLLAEKILSIADRNNIRCILHNFPDAAIQLNCRNIHMPLGELKALADNGYKTHLGNDFLEHFNVPPVFLIFIYKGIRLYKSKEYALRKRIIR